MGLAGGLLKTGFGLPLVIAGIGALFGNDKGITGWMSGLLGENGLGTLLEKLGIDKDLASQIGLKAAGPLAALAGSAMMPAFLGKTVKNMTMSLSAIALAFTVAQGFYKGEFNGASFAGLDLNNTLNLGSGTPSGLTDEMRQKLGTTNISFDPTANSGTSAVLANAKATIESIDNGGALDAQIAGQNIALRNGELFDADEDLGLEKSLDLDEIT